MNRRSMFTTCVLTSLVSSLAASQFAGASADAAMLVATVQKPTPAEDFKSCRTDPGNRLPACERAIASGKLSKKDLSTAYSMRGGEWFLMGDLAKAVSDLDQATRLDPSNQVAFVDKARVLLARNDSAGALAAANSAIKLIATGDAYAVRGQILQALGQNDEAIADYKRVLAGNPGMDQRKIAEAGLAQLATGPQADAQQCHDLAGDAAVAACTRAIESGKLSGRALASSYFYRAYEYLKKADYDHALADSTAAIRADASDSYAHSARALALIGKNDATNALIEANEGIRLLPQGGYAIAVRGEAYRALGRRDEARADYNKAMSLDADGASRQVAQAGLAALAAGSGPTASTNPSDDAQQCHDLSGDAAIAACSRAIGSGKLSGRTLASSYFYRAYEYLKKADYDRALADSMAAISADSSSGYAHSAKAMALIGKNDAANALIEANEGVRLIPQSGYAVAVRGEAYRALGRRDEAATDYNKALTLNPDATSKQLAQAGIAALAAGAGNGPAANAGTNPQQDAQQCHNGDTDDVRREACGRAIASGKFSGKELSALYKSRALIYDVAKDRAHAIADYTEAIRSDPANKDALRNRGADYLEQGDYPAAIADLTAVIKLDPKDMAELPERGLAYYKNKQYSLAVADFDDVIKADPKAAYAYVARGNALEKLGRHNEAVADFNAALTISPDSQWARMAQAGLQGFGAEYAAAIDMLSPCIDQSGDAAIAACTRAIATNRLAGADLAIAYDRRAQAYATKADRDSTLRDLTEAVRLAPTQDRYSRRAALYRQLGRRDEAIADYNKVLSYPFHPFDPYAAMQDAATAGLRALGVDPQAALNDQSACTASSGNDTFAACNRAIATGRFAGDDLAALYQSRARRYYQMQDYAHAIADYDAVIKLQPANFNAFASRAWSYAGLKNYDQALKGANETLRINASADAFVLRGFVMLQLERRDEAIADYAMSLSLNPPDSLRQTALGALQYLGIDTAAADADSRKCNDLSGDEAIAACGRAIASRSFAGSALALLYSDSCFQRVQKGDYDQAVADCDKSIDLDAKQYYAHVFKAQALLAKNDAAGALVEVNLGVDHIVANAFYAFAVRGEIERALGRPDEARADYNKVIAGKAVGWPLQTAQAGLAALGPANAGNTDDKQCLALKKEAAIAPCGRAISSGKFSGNTLAALYEQKGEQEYQLNQLDQAMADLNEAIRLNPSFVEAYASRGFVDQARNDNPAAIADFSKLIELQPNGVAGYGLRGGVYATMGDMKNAILDYSNAIRLDPQDEEIRDVRGLVYGQTNDNDHAIADFTEAIRIKPTYLKAFWHRAAAYFAKKDFDHAIADYDQAIKLDSKQAALFHDRGDTYYSKHDYDHAIADYGEAIKLDPNDMQLLIDRGDTYREIGRRAEAGADYNRVLSTSTDSALKQAAQAGLAALAAAPPSTAAQTDAEKCKNLSDDQGIAACGRLIAAGGVSNAVLAGLHNQRAGQYYLAKQFDPALADLNEAIRLAPSSGQTYANRAVVDIAKNDRQAALSDYSEAIKRGPDDVQSYIGRGNVYRDLGDADRALADYGEAIRLDPKKAAAFYGRGNAYAAKHDLADARADFDAAIKLDRKFVISAATSNISSNKATGNDLAAVYGVRADAYFADQDGDHAFADYSEQIRLQPLSDARAYAQRGILYSVANNNDKAIVDLSTAITLDPNNAEAFAFRGEAYYEGPHDYDRAIADLTDAIRINAGPMAYHADRADAYYAKGDYDHAIADYDASIARAPKDGGLYSKKARALLAKHDNANALAAADQGVLLRDDNDQAFAIRGDVYRALGRNAEARADYNKALSIYKDNKTAAAGLKALGASAEK